MIDCRQIMNTASDFAVTSAFTAAVGYMAARIFTSLNPLHGALYCGVASLVSRAVSPVMDKLFSGERANAASKFLGEILSIGSVVVISSLISVAAGFTVPYMTGMYLLAIMVATSVVMKFAEFALALATEAAYG